MMETLNAYGRPFHQRATEMVVPPLSPAEVGAMLQLGAADAFDAFIVTGGLPLICMAEVERGRGERVLARIQTSWTSWRGRATEPLLREALDRVLVADPLGAGVVGGYWTRTNNPEIDIVIADRQPVAKRILGVGSIKWLEHAPFDRRDLAQLMVHRSQLPGATDNTPLIVIARSGCDVDGVTAYGPDELLNAWRVGPEPTSSRAE